MGDAADDIIDQGMDDWFNDRPSRRKKRNFQAGSGDFHWRQGDGVIISMWDMTDIHLENCINLCLEYGNSAKLKQLRQVQEHRQQLKQPVQSAEEEQSYVDFLKRTGDL